MKAITVKREFADRIANGTKRYEVRNFRTDYRGPVVVTVSKEKIALCMVNLMAIADSLLFFETGEITAEELAYGKWGWQLSTPIRVKPMPVRGQLGLWAWNYPDPEYLSA
jgi:hypothetical protein